VRAERNYSFPSCRITNHVSLNLTPCYYQARKQDQSPAIVMARVIALHRDHGTRSLQERHRCAHTVREYNDRCVYQTSLLAAHHRTHCGSLCQYRFFPHTRTQGNVSMVCHLLFQPAASTTDELQDPQALDLHSRYLSVTCLQAFDRVVTSSHDLCYVKDLMSYKLHRAFVLSV
jgi:hypothetical protein